MITFKLRGKIERNIMDWCITHGGNTDPAVWRDNFDMKMPETDPEYISNILKDGVVMIPEPYDKWIKLLLWNIEDFESHLDTEGEDWLVTSAKRIEGKNSIWYEEEHLTSLNYAYKVCDKLRCKLEQLKESL